MNGVVLSVPEEIALHLFGSSVLEKIGPKLVAICYFRELDGTVVVTTYIHNQGSFSGTIGLVEETERSLKRGCDLSGTPYFDFRICDLDRNQDPNQRRSDLTCLPYPPPSSPLGDENFMLLI